MKQFLKFFLMLSLSLNLLACQGVREGLSLKKERGIEEFLIEKKNPLTVPPDFSNLPKPKDLKDQTKEKDEKIDLKKVLKETNDSKKTISSGDLEKSISNILNKKQ